MRGVRVGGQTVRIDPDGDDHVEFEQGEIGQIVLAQRLCVEMRVHEPQASEPAAGRGIATFEIGQKDRSCVPDYDVGDLAPAVYENTYLPADFVREFREVSRDLL